LNGYYQKRAGEDYKETKTGDPASGQDNREAQDTVERYRHQRISRRCQGASLFYA